MRDADRGVDPGQLLDRERVGERVGAAAAVLLRERDPHQAELAVIRAVARTVLLRPLTEPAEVGYRQHVLDDCLQHPDEVRALFDLAGVTIAPSGRC